MVAKDKSKLKFRGRTKDAYKDMQIKISRGDFSTTSTNNDTNNKDSSASTLWLTEPYKALRHLNISASVKARNIIPADVCCAHWRTKQKTFTLIVLYNPHVLLVVARTFAA